MLVIKESDNCHLLFSNNKNIFHKYILENYDDIIIDNPQNKNHKNMLDIFEKWYNNNNDKTIFKKNLDNIEKNKITIITCVKDKFKYLKDSITSLINQNNIDKNRWYNLIINDGSDDEIDLINIFGEEDYKNILQPFLDQIIIINNKEWKGIVECHIQAMEMVNTEFVGILDSDDALHPDCLKLVLDKYNEFNDNNNNESIFVITDFCITDQNFIKIKDGFTQMPSTNEGLIYDGFGLAFRTFRLIDYYKTNGYNRIFKYGAEDMDLIYKLEKVAKPIFINEQLYMYRQFDTKNMHLSKSKYHIYNCKLSKIINSIDRFGNNFTIKIIGSKIPKDLINDKNEYENYKMKYLNLLKTTKPFKYKYQYFYIELYLGNNNELFLEFLKVNTPNLLLLKPFLDNYIHNFQHIFKIENIEYSPITNNFILTPSSKFNIDNFMKLQIINCYEHIFIVKNKTKSNDYLKLLYEINTTLFKYIDDIDDIPNLINTSTTI